MWTYKGIDVFAHSREETLRSGMGLRWYANTPWGKLRSETKEGMRELINHHRGGMMRTKSRVARRNGVR